MDVSRRRYSWWVPDAALERCVSSAHERLLHAAAPAPTLNVLSVVRHMHTAMSTCKQALHQLQGQACRLSSWLFSHSVGRALAKSRQV
jgi:hypothetical protein